ncbi:MAG: hypothetical protein IPO08_22145 [Xanthomonadales bacterium]|nr:hypothetical protein [Xanthomonadales bacterium]
MSVPGREDADGADMTVPDDLSIPDDDILEIVDDEQEADELAAEKPQEEEVADDEESSRLADYEARLADETDRIRQEAALAIHQSEKKKFETQATAAGILVQSIEERIQNANAALIRAREDADHAAEVHAQNAIRALEGQREQAIATKNAALQYAARRPPEVRPSVRPPPAMAQRWVQNNDWTTGADHRPEQAFLVEVSRELAQRMDPNSRGYYDAVTQRMRQAFPNLPIKDLDGRATRGPAPRPVQRRQSPVTGGSTVGAQPRASGGNNDVRFTQSDLTLFKRLNIDVNDKAQAQALKKARAERIRKGDR